MAIDAKSWTDKRMHSLPATCVFTGKEVTVRILPNQSDSAVILEVVAQIDNVFYRGHIVPSDDGDWSSGPFEFFSDKELADREDDLSPEERELWDFIYSNSEVEEFLNDAIREHYKKHPIFLDGEQVYP